MQESRKPAGKKGKKGKKVKKRGGDDGAILATYDLDAAPAWDGMAAADGRIFLSLKDGSLRCWSGE